MSTGRAAYTKRTLNWLTAEVHKDRGPVVVAHCAYCPATAWFTPQHLPPEPVMRMLKQKGWKAGMNTKKPCCPKCVAKFKSINAQENGTVAKNKVVAMPNQTSKKVERKLYSLLETHFDEETGLYHQDWSDAKIAEASGFSETAVARVRNEAFGPLRPPSEVEELQGEVAAIRQLCDDLESKIARMAKKFGG